MNRGFPHANPAPGAGGVRRHLDVARALVPYLWPRAAPDLRVRVVVALGCLLAAKLAIVFMPILYKEAVDALAVEAAVSVVVPVALIVAYGLTRMASSAFADLRDLVFAKVVQRAVRRVALETFTHLHRLSLRSHLSRRTGGIGLTIERGKRGVEFLLIFLLFNVLPTVLEIVLVTAVLWHLYAASFAAVTFAAVAGYIAFTIGMTRWRIKFRRTMNAVSIEASATAVDSLLNYEAVKSFANETHEAARFDRMLQAYEGAAVRHDTSLALLNMGQGLIIAIGLVVVMMMAAHGIAHGAMTVGDFVLVNAYLMQLYQPLGQLGFVYREIRQALVDMESMLSLMRERPEIQDASAARPLAVRRGDVKFEDVVFGYGPGRPVLNGVSFTVPAGRRLAIVGPSGAGKSTVVRLLCRHFDVNAGTVKIDGHDVRDVTQASLRAAIGVVPQDTVLFNDTIHYNIAYGRPDATPAEVERAARLARMHGFIVGTPEGYRTRVGERGLKLSGGERQRIAIARVILKDPAILVLDEATSALDTRTEHEIRASLDAASRGRTALVIAHRLSTIIDADEIIVLEAGRIVERGRHAELVARGGVYAGMWHRQQDDARRGSERRHEHPKPQWVTTLGRRGTSDEVLGEGGPEDRAVTPRDRVVSAVAADRGGQHSPRCD